MRIIAGIKHFRGVVYGMTDRTRREVLRDGGSLAVVSKLLAGCSGNGGERSETEPVSATDTLTHVASPMEMARSLEHLLESDDFEESHPFVFVGNPNFHDYGFSEYEVSVERDSEVGRAIEEGRDAEEVWNLLLESRGEEFPDSVITEEGDVLEEDVIGAERLDMDVLYPKGMPSPMPFVRDFGERFGDITGIAPDVTVHPANNLTSGGLDSYADRDGDRFVFGILESRGKEYGAAHPDAIYAEIRVPGSDALAYRGLPEKMLHEGLHGIANMPHIPRKEALMSKGTRNPGKAEVFEQTKEMVKRYVTSEKVYSSKVEDGEVTAEFSYRPVHRIENGEEFLKENTEAVLQQIDFPVGDWSLEADGDTVYMRKGGVEIELEPGDKQLYQEVSVRRTGS